MKKRSISDIPKVLIHRNGEAKTYFFFYVKNRAFVSPTAHLVATKESTSLTIMEALLLNTNVTSVT